MQNIVFDKKWFEKYQSRLFWLLNAPIVKYWFRWVMDIPEKGVINKITPSAFHYDAMEKEDKIHVLAKFSSDNVYAKRLYFAFKPLWYMFHFIDWSMLDRMDSLAKLSFGFDTLTQYPGSIGTDNPIDGFTEYAPAAEDTFTNIHNGNGNSSDKTTNTANHTWINASATSNMYFGIRRAVFCYDTSSLTSSATISAATFSLFITAVSDDMNQGVGLVASAPASTSDIANGDYQTMGSTRFCDTDLDITGITTSAYNDWTVNAGGIAAISKTAITKYGTRVTCDINNSAPTWTSNGLAKITSRMSGFGSNMPKLVVTYTLPSTARAHLSLLGVA